MDGVPTVVVGVMPASFAFTDPRVDVWIPAPYVTKTTATDAYAFAAVARLRDGATIAEARSELTRLTAELDPSYPNNGYRVLVSTARTLLDATVGSIAVTLWILLVAVGLVLLVACANVANLFLARSEAKQREIAVRRALGAGNRAIVDRLSALPAVSAVSASTCLPLSEGQLCQGGPLFIEGHPYSTGAIAPFVASRAIDAGYFETMRRRMVRGRGIERGDIDREEPVVVVNQALVNMAFSGQDPIGQRVRFGNPAVARGSPEWLTIVGVVANTPIFGLAGANPFPQLYMPMFASRNLADDGDRP